jgi:hypothetical protein
MKETCKCQHPHFISYTLTPHILDAVAGNVSWAISRCQQGILQHQHVPVDSRLPLPCVVQSAKRWVLKKLLSNHSAMSASVLLGADAAFAQSWAPDAYLRSNGPWAVNELSSGNLMRASTSDSNAARRSSSDAWAPTSARLGRDIAPIGFG